MVRRLIARRGSLRGRSLSEGMVLERRLPGKRDVHGEWIEGRTLRIKLRGVTAPFGERDITETPDAKRLTNLRRFWVSRVDARPLRVMPRRKTEGDMILWNGGRWEVTDVIDWNGWLEIRAELDQ